MLCTKCNQERTLEDFYASADGRLRRPCKRCKAEYLAKWRKANPNRCRVLDARSRVKRREVHRIYMQGWHDEHREEEATYAANWRKQNRDHIRAYDRKRYAVNPFEREAALSRARRSKARRRGSAIRDTDQYDLILMGDPCSYCGTKTEQVDHIEPVMKGGDHEWTNLTSACARCNRAKGTKSLLGFLFEEPEILAALSAAR